MGAPITWAVLAKAIGDPTTVQEQIIADLATHNADDSAHAQSNESLYNHRIAELLDHLDESIKNIKLEYGNRAYSAIVDAGGDADYTTLQGAIDYVNSKGGGRILVRAGTYTLEADITLYSNIEIAGEDADSVILDFNETAYSIKGEGTAGTHKSNIVLRNLQVKNSDDAAQGAIYFDYVDNLEIINCYTLDNYAAGGNLERDIQIDHCTHITILGNRAKGGYMAIDIDNCDGVIINRNYFEDHVNGAIHPDDTANISVTENVFVDITGGLVLCSTAVEGLTICENRATEVNGAGIALDGVSRATIANNILTADAGAGDGIYIGSGDRVTVTSNVVKDFGADGIELETQDFSTVVGNACTGNAGYGVNISDAASDKNIVVANSLVGNTTGGFNDSGTNTDSGHNITA